MVSDNACNFVGKNSVIELVKVLQSKGGALVVYESDNQFKFFRGTYVRLDWCWAS